MKALAIKGLPILAACALVGGAVSANAATLDFDFTITGMLLGHVTGETVTGEIDGLSDNSTGAASAVILDSFDATALGSIPGCTPCDTTMSPWQIANDAMHNPVNDFTVSNGQIVAANFTSVGPPADLSSLTISLSSFGGIAILTGPEGDVTGGPVTFSPVPPGTPLPAALPLFATGLGALGLLGWRRKRKPGASLLGAA